MPSDSQHKFAFFRQGGWMMVATLASGLCMFAVHMFAPWLGDRQFGLFGTLLALMNLMMIPALGLQTVFAQQSAAAVTEDDHKRLSGTVHALVLWTLALWAAMAGLALLFRHDIISLLTITNPMALWVILIIGLLQLWLPILLGIMQGRQNFLWLGWALISNGVIRFIAVGIIVVVLGGLAAGAITGALIGITIAFAIAVWQTRNVWKRKGLDFEWRNWLARVLPLTIGLGASQFIFSVDMVFVRAMFGEDQTGYYSFAGMIGRGLVVFTLPLSIVMFPKVVHSFTHGKRSDVFAYALASTAFLGTIAAIGCTLLAKGIRWLIVTPEIGNVFLASLSEKLLPFNEAMLAVTALIPWFVWCMLPLCVAIVMLNNLLARKEFRMLPWLLVVAALYAVALSFLGTSFVRIIQVLGAFNLLFLAVLSTFTWIDRRKLARNERALPGG